MVGRVLVISITTAPPKPRLLEDEISRAQTAHGLITKERVSSIIYGVANNRLGSIVSMSPPDG